MKIWRVSIVGLMAVVVFPSLALGVLLRNDTNAMSGWRGFVNFAAADATYTLDVDADYAVYAPGNYLGSDPSSGSDYVYAYEVLSNVNPLSVEVSLLTVGIAAGSGAHNLGTDTSAAAPGEHSQPGSDVAPSYASLSGSSARWFFDTNPLDYSEDSVTLIFTSRYGPRWMTATVADGGLSDDESLPSPIPEPATLALLAVGAAWVLAMRRQR